MMRDAREWARPIGWSALSLVVLVGCSDALGDRTSSARVAPAPAADGGDPSAKSPDHQESVDLNATIDYIVPPAALAPAAATLATPAAPDGATVTYVTFAGETLTMRRFNGRDTALLVSQAVLDQAGLARIRTLVDEHDIIYETLHDLTGAEPAGDGDLLRIAIVDHTCGGGCGYIGSKGVEILTPIFSFDDYIAYVDHEMTHNFDRRSSFLFNSRDIAHSWTAFADQYSQVYPRRAFARLDADDVLELRIRERLGPFEAFPGASWQMCVRDASCDPPGDIDSREMALLAEGGTILRVAQLYGPRAMKAWVPTVDRLIDERGLDPGAMTQQDRIDLLVESLSLAVGADLSCFYDFWQWPLSSGLRARLAVFGANALCQDGDHDGFSSIAHDCNDANAAISPGAKEVLNLADDDCDRVVDDVLVDEPSDFPPSTSPLVVPLPGHIRGHLAVGDEDGFQIHLAAPMTVRFTVVSRNTVNGTLSVEPKGGAGVVPPPYFSAGRTIVLKLDLAAGDWVFFVSDYVDAGDYDLTVQPDYRLDMAADYWPITFTPAPGAVSATNPRQVTLPVPTVPPALAGTPGLYARYWVSGQGFVGQATAKADCIFSFTFPAGADLTPLTYRVHFGANGVPLSPLSQPGALLAPPPPGH
jgi:hypothetical protein